jgi:hypothetical protein
MWMKASDTGFAQSIVTAPLLLGSILLFIDISISNSISQLVSATVVLALFSGLVFGLFAMWWYTKEQLRILAINHEFKGYGSRKINAAVFVGLAIFLFFSFLTIYFQTNVLFSGYFFLFFQLFFLLLSQDGV